MTTVHIHRSHGYVTRLGQKLMQQRTACQFTDLSVQSKDGGDIYACHLNIFHANTKLPKQQPNTTMELNVGKDILPLLLDYMSTGNIDIPDPLLLEAVEACHSLGMTVLYQQCVQEAVIGCHITPTNVIHWLRHIQDELDSDVPRADIKLVKDQCDRIIKCDLDKVTESSSYLSLEYLGLQRFLCYIRKIDIDTDLHFKVALQWIEAKLSERRRYLRRILETFDLKMLSAVYLEHVLYNHSPVLEEDEQQSSYHAELSPQQKLIYERASRHTQSLLVVIGQEPSEPRTSKGYKCIFRYNSDTWSVEIDEHIEETKQSVCTCFSACLVPGGFVLSGGTKSPGTLCNMYTIEKDKWTSLTPLKTQREAHGSIYHRCKIYVIGGYTDVTDRSASVDSMSPYGKQWQAEAPLPRVAYCNPSVATVKDVIYVYTGEILCFLNDTNNVWELIQCDRLPANDVGARMASAWDKLCIVGGKGTKLFLCYDPAAKEWEEKHSPSYEYKMPAVYYDEGKLHLYGGNYECWHESYLPLSGVWEIIKYKDPYCNLGKAQVLTGR